MRMHLICLSCKKKYSIPFWAMRHMTYREYSYCDDCYKQKEGKLRSLFARIMTRRGNNGPV